MRTLCLAVTACVIGLSVETPLAQDRDGIVVRTQSGPVRGVHNGAVEAFLGIPYAAPPVGDKRWRPPQPPQSWTDVREANAFGAYCAAAKSTNGPRSEAEDCLFINVWRPSDVSADGRLPVYVFIHGGGFINGSSNQADMTEVVEKTGVVGVSFNYRLGALGFFSHPDVTKDSGDFGLMDQQAALRWVHDNIAAFGGDPARVTLGGESAGGYSVCAHLAAPGSAGLFAQAMMQSGSCASIPLAAAQKNAGAIADAVGCKGTDPADCLRAVPVGKLIDVPYPPYGVVALPTDGTGLLPVAPRKAVADGSFARVAIVIGANRDEGRTFRQGDIGRQEADYDKWIKETFGEKADKVLAQYRWPKDADQYTGAYLAGAVATDSGWAFGIGGCPALKLTQDLAKYTPVYAYEFAHRTGPGLTREHGAYEWGAGHAAELAYLFPSFNNGEPITPLFKAGERALAESMKVRWGAFVKQGVPSDKTGASWPLFNAAGQLMSLQANDRSFVLSTEMFNREHNCKLWEQNER
ncbi:MAG: carboxylesterase family protein [Hyphomicrobiales bacterium]|nr:carboxylesterase family protein [Hyphomicrobiales bacterium]